MKTQVCKELFFWNRARLVRTLGSMLVVVVFAGCRPAKTDQIVIRGSNTIGEELAPRLIAEYRKEHPGVAFDLEFKGTTYGLGALLVGRCDIAAASRDLTTNEVELARARGIEFDQCIIGAYSVAVIVNAGNPVGDLSAERVRDIFTGAIQNWKAVEGPDAPIHLYIRDPVSGTYLGFRELAMENRPYALNLKTFTNDTQIVQAVAQDANAIGYAGVEPEKKPGVKAVSIGGVAPAVPSVKKGQYPYARVLRLYTDKANQAPAMRDFIQFVQSTRGQAILDQMGFVPRP